MKNVHDAAEGFQYERRQERKQHRAADGCVGEATSVSMSFNCQGAGCVWGSGRGCIQGGKGFA